MAARRLYFLPILALASLACSGPRASLEIEDARASWVDLTVNRHLFVDIDLLGHDQMGDSIGTYCVTIILPFQTDKTACAADLSDGDRKTFRIETTGDVADAVKVGIRVRHAQIDIGRDVIGPVTPPR